MESGRIPETLLVVIIVLAFLCVEKDSFSVLFFHHSLLSQGKWESRVRANERKCIKSSKWTSSGEVHSLVLLARSAPGKCVHCGGRKDSGSIANLNNSFILKCSSSTVGTMPFFFCAGNWSALRHLGAVF